jgi:hypothetical protein
MVAASVLVRFGTEIIFQPACRLMLGAVVTGNPAGVHVPPALVKAKTPVPGFTALSTLYPGTYS